MMEEAGCYLLLACRQRAHCSVEVRVNDSLSPAETLEGLRLQDTGTGAELHRPQAAQHELEIGRLDPRLARPRRPVKDTGAGLADHDLAGLHLVENGLDERRGDLDLLIELCAPVVLRERQHDRFAP